jgi:DDE domain
MPVSVQSVRRWYCNPGHYSSENFAVDTLGQRRGDISIDGRDDCGAAVLGLRAFDGEGEVLDLLVQRRRDKAAAVKLLRRLLKKQGFAPDVLVTDKLRSYSAAKSEIGRRLAMSGACARTIGLRIRVSRHDGASVRCRVSNRPDQPNASCPFTPPFKTPSTSRAILHPAARSATSEKKLSGRGEPPPRHESEPGLPNGAGLNSVWVTAPRASQARRFAWALVAERFAAAGFDTIVTDVALVFGVEASRLLPVHKPHSVRFERDENTWIGKLHTPKRSQESASRGCPCR